MSEHVDYNERFRDQMETLNKQRGQKSGRQAPPDGAYVVTLIGWTEKEFPNRITKEPEIFFSPRFKVCSVLETIGDEKIDEDALVGQEFFGDLINITDPNRQFSVDDAFILAEAIDGEPAESAGDAFETCKLEADNERSTLIEVRIVRKKAKDGTKTYTNVHINGVYDDEVEDEE